MPKTGWLEPPKTITGQDHLATIAVCEALYSQLLPGITNVTDRARCYSFFPWLLWAIDKYDLPKDRKSRVELVRRAECLWCLVGIHHEDGGDSRIHGAGLAGREKLIPAWRETASGEGITLSTFATQDDVPARYFKNKLGGFGQYYLGTFKDLKILTNDESLGLQYDEKRATALAEAFAAGVDGQRFLDAVRRDRVSRHTLDQLQTFCPCQLSKNVRERNVLVSLFFNQPGVFHDTGDEGRRRTLLVLLDLAQQLQAGNSPLAPDGLDLAAFRGGTYTGSLGKGHPWHPSDALEPIRRQWATYQRMELLSVAIQAVFWVTLTSLQEAGAILATSTQVGPWLVSAFSRRRLVNNLRERFVSALERIKRNLPPVSDWEDARHELQLYFQIEEQVGDSTPDNLRIVLRSAIDIILALAARDNDQELSHEGFALAPEFFQAFPINLQALRELSRGEWCQLDMGHFLEWLVARWCLDVHLRVGLQKLRYEDRDTFRVRPSETGLRVVEPWPPAYSRPRFQQAFQILRDLGALSVDPRNGRVSLSPLGRQLLEGGRD